MVGWKWIATYKVGPIFSSLSPCVLEKSDCGLFSLGKFTSNLLLVFYKYFVFNKGTCLGAVVIQCHQNPYGIAPSTYTKNGDITP